MRVGSPNSAAPPASAWRRWRVRRRLPALLSPEHTPRSHPKEYAATVLALLLGVGFTFCLGGYQFGKSNHTVYLLDAMRHNRPDLLAHDWFLSSTFEYHGSFAKLTELLMSAGLLRPGFFVGYALLVLLLHVAWLRIVRLAGGSRRVYLLSVAMYYLSAGGTGLGMYSFLQDSAFLPSNIANVAMLWGVLMLLRKRWAAAGVWLGIAGFFHLNHAIVGIGLWGFFSAWSWMAIRLRPPPRPSPGVPGEGGVWPWFIGSGVLLSMALPNVLPAVYFSFTHPDPLSLSQFVELYARIRHPHHYDPSTWPLALWLCFAWPIPIAIVQWRFQKSRDMAAMAGFFAALQIVALLCAGIWYVSDSAIQLSLWRFSIFLQLLACIGAAQFAYRIAGNLRQRITGISEGPRDVMLFVNVLALLVFAGAQASPMLRSFTHNNLGTLMLLLDLLMLSALYEAAPTPLVRQNRWTAAALVVILAGGVGVMFYANATAGAMGLRAVETELDDPDYLAVCHWAAENTPEDALFLVPPDEQAFRLEARRAIVVNFKGVPQFGGELVEWRNRLCDVLDCPNLQVLPHRFDLALKAIAQRYSQVPADHLLAVARKYDADYIVAEHDLSGPLELVFVKGRYHLYHLLRS